MNVSCCCGRGRNTNVIVMCLAAEGWKSYWSGCIKVETVIRLQIFLHFGAGNFLFQIPSFTACCDIFLFFALAARSISFWSCNFCVKASLCKMLCV